MTMTDKIDDNKAIEPRRDFMQKAAIAIGTGVAGMNIGQALAMGKKSSKPTNTSPDFSTLDYRNNYWARDALARIQGTLILESRNLVGTKVRFVALSQTRKTKFCLGLRVFRIHA